MKSFSTDGQYISAVDILKGKPHGTYLDFGCPWPIEGNNTYLLEKNIIKGLSFDINSNDIESWKNTDRHYKNAICADLLEIDIEKHIFKGYKIMNHRNDKLR